MDSTPTIYNKIGHGYRDLRLPDERIAAQILSALGDAKTICNVGAGTGSYEPTDRMVTAVEPSELMIAQRTNSNPVVQAVAEELPFAENQFDASLTVLSIHHWADANLGLKEMRRVSRRQVVLTFDPSCIDDLWLVRDYLPEIKTFELKRAVSIENISRYLNAEQIIPVPIPFDCTDGFQAAYWRRPEAYLDPRVRASISTLAQLPSPLVDAAIEKLRADIESRAWHNRYRDLLTQTEKDFGYRLIVAG